MNQNASYEPFSDERLPVPEALFGTICRSGLNEARELCTGLPELTRAKLAIFCNARAHLREVGRAIAGACSQQALISEGGYAGAILFRQITEEPEPWGAVVKAPTKRVTLAGDPSRSKQARSTAA